MENIKKIDKKELKKLIDTKSNFYLIDVLPNDYYQEKHIVEAINVCVYEMAFLDNIKKLDIKEKEMIVLYGSSINSFDSMDAAKKLRKAGYEDVNVYMGGIDEWEKEGFDIVYDKSKKIETFRVQNKRYDIDKDKSSVEWTGRNFNSKHVGSIDISKGFVEFKDEMPINGEFEIDMDSIKNHDIKDEGMKGYLIHHLISEDFFEVSNYPKAKIKFKKADLMFKGEQGESHYLIVADLSIKNVIKEITFEAILGPKEEGIFIQTQFFIDRTKWDVMYGSSNFFEKLGKHLVNNMIYFDIYLIFK